MSLKHRASSPIYKGIYRHLLDGGGPDVEADALTVDVLGILELCGIEN